AGAPGAGPRLRAQAELMLERYGIVTREAVLAEGVPGGFAALYGELSNLEVLGTARRGYFVEGLGGAQFALAGAVERLRALPRSEREYRVIAATDPANPYGALLGWPKREDSRRPSRTPGASVLLRDGEPVLYVERGGRADGGDERGRRRRRVAGAAPDERDRASNGRRQRPPDEAGAGPLGDRLGHDRDPEAAGDDRSHHRQVVGLERHPRRHIGIGE